MQIKKEDVELMVIVNFIGFMVITILLCIQIIFFFILSTVRFANWKCRTRRRKDH